MIAQVLLSVLLALLGLYACTQKQLAVGWCVACAVSVGLLFVWWPSSATWFANQVGIGRGADLVFYFGGAFAAMAILNLHLRLRAQQEQLTELARHVALAQARVRHGPLI